MGFMDEGDVDVEIEEITLVQPAKRMDGVPRSMRELAEASALEEVVDDSPVPLKDTPSRGAASSSTKNGRTGTKRRIGKRSRNSRTATSDDSEGEGSHDQHDKTLVAPTTRVLRPRPSKSAARLQEEKAADEAYRRAVAQ
jgi:xeroderma pigmentosum group C-complementing protein